MKENKMGTMPIGKLIITMSGPAIVSMLVQAIYNVVDSLFVAHLGAKEGERALEAITIVFPVQLLMIAVGIGTAIGVNSFIARSLGAKKYDDANVAAGTGIKLAVFGWIFFLIAGGLGSERFMSIFASNDYVVTNGAAYLRIVTMCSLFVMVAHMCEKIVQATGNMIAPMFSIIIGAVINIALDPIFIYGYLGIPRLGLAGAAIATVIGQCGSMILIMFLLFKKDKYITVKLNAKFKKNILKNIYSVGLPALIMQAIGSVMMVGMNAVLAGISGTAVAVLGVYSRIQSFIFMPVFGINQGSMPVIGYNYGARNKERLMDAYKTAFIIALCIMSFGLILFEAFPNTILKMFDASPAMMEIGVPAIRKISLCFLPAAFGIITSGLFQGTGHGLMSLFASLVRQLIGILPLGIILSKLFGIAGVWWAFPLAEVLGVVYAVFMARFLYRNKIRNLEKVSL